MARRSNGKVRRDRITIARRSDRLPSLSVSPRSGRPLSEVEDRRLYNPTRHSSLRSDRRWFHSLSYPQPSSPKAAFSFSPKISFREAHRLLICVRRKERKEVLFAKGVGGSRTRRGRRNRYSEISCKG